MTGRRRTRVISVRDIGEDTRTTGSTKGTGRSCLAGITNGRCERGGLRVFARDQRRRQFLTEVTGRCRFVVVAFTVGIAGDLEPQVSVRRTVGVGRMRTQCRPYRVAPTVFTVIGAPGTVATWLSTTNPTGFPNAALISAALASVSAVV